MEYLHVKQRLMQHFSNLGTRPTRGARLSGGVKRRFGSHDQSLFAWTSGTLELTGMFWHFRVKPVIKVKHIVKEIPVYKTVKVYKTIPVYKEVPVVKEVKVIKHIHVHKKEAPEHHVPTGNKGWDQGGGGHNDQVYFAGEG